MIWVTMAVLLHPRDYYSETLLHQGPWGFAIELLLNGTIL